MPKLINEKKGLILDFIKENPSSSSNEIYNGLKAEIGLATIKRALQKLIVDSWVVSTGNGRATKYQISKGYEILGPADVEAYFTKDIDDRKIRNSFNHSLMDDVLKTVAIFTDNELSALNGYQQMYAANIAKLTHPEYQKELERLAIDLSWKSSQIEGNTYSLLETERLLKDKETALGKTKDEAVMLLNHKEALDFIIANPAYIHPISVSVIEDIHSILIKDLGISRNIRQRRGGISGTNYRPLENEFQIKEALGEMCTLINQQQNVFAKALLALVLLSYIQAFADGNKRTARIISNAILVNNKYCPISFRTVNSIDYKKAMLIFYEQNNITAFKKIFIDQFRFAVENYF